MTNSLPRCTPKFFLRLLGSTAQLAIVIAILGGLSAVPAATNKPPKLISQASSTRAVAFETVTMRSEPFGLTSTVQFSPDPRTRIAIFAMDVELLGTVGGRNFAEGANAFTADAQDASGKRYPLRVEYVGRVPGFEGITMIIVRLADDMGDLGDVLVGLNLHGVQSNRVRVAIGHAGGGPADDSGAIPTPAPSTPPAADAPLVPDPFTGPSADADTVRFLEQASWGPTRAEVDRVKAMGFMAYLDEQLNAPVTNPAKGSNYPDLVFPNNDQATECPSTMPSDPTYNQTVCNRDKFSVYPLQRTYYSSALYGPDQLRQRVAFALHQILVVSQASEVNRPSWMTIYLQALDRGAFGNYRTLLEEITLSPAMGEYLDMRLSTRTSPNENFAREILQLFTIGTNELNLDGSSKLDAQGMPLASYSQTNVNEFTRVFTGWNLNPTVIGPGISNWRDPMIPRGGTNHDFGAKTLLSGATTAACSSTSGAPNVACAQSDLAAGLNNLFNHPNVGPFVGKQLIQHMVTSNPSGAYVERVARAFNNDCDVLYPQACSNARGNMKAVVRAILLDPEARGDVKTDPHFGKLREPALYLNGFLRAFNVKSFDKTSTSDGVLGNRSSSDFAGTLDQPIFQPPTVFSYYQPGYEVPGFQMLGPAFGILSTSTTLRRANAINTLVYTGVAANTTPTAGSPDRPRGTSVDLANLEAMAANPASIADYLNALILHGTMHPQVRTSIITAMNAINDANVTTRNRKRAQVAAYLVITSSQYDIQR